MGVRISHRNWAIILACALAGALWLGFAFGAIAAFVGAVCGAGGGVLACLLQEGMHRDPRI